MLLRITANTCLNFHLVASQTTTGNIWDWWKPCCHTLSLPDWLPLSWCAFISPQRDCMFAVRLSVWEDLVDFKFVLSNYALKELKFCLPLTVTEEKTSWHLDYNFHSMSINYLKARQSVCLSHCFLLWSFGSSCNYWISNTWDTDSVENLVLISFILLSTVVPDLSQVPWERAHQQKAVIPGGAETGASRS